MSYNLPNNLCGPNASGDVAFASLGSNFDLNSGEGFVGYKSNLGTYYQNAFVIDTTSTVPTVFSNNGTPSFSISSNGNLVVFGDVTRGALNFGDTNAVNFGSNYVPLGTAYFKEIKVGSTNTNGASLTTNQNYHLQLRSGSNDVKFSVANTFTDTNNYERLEIGWDTDVATIDSTAAGTGTQRNISIRRGGSQILSGDGLGAYLYQAGGRYVSYSQDQFVPSTNGTAFLGREDKRWRTVFTKGVNTDIQTVTATSASLDFEDNVVLCDCTSNNITVNLPASSLLYTGQQFHIKKIDASANTVTIDADGTETIDGALTQTLSSQWEKITLVSDGSNWFTI